jgi:flavin reductase (DIM6/NTAB) family NADH-FMN oxidoreductase RutF
MDAGFGPGHNRHVSSEDLPAEFDIALRGGFATGALEGIGDDTVYDTVPEPEQLQVGGGRELDPALEFRRTLGMFATGVTVITTQVAGEAHGMTANAFMSVSLQPPLVLISVDRRAKMNTLLREGTRYGISVLADGQTSLSDHFAGRLGEDAPEPLFEIVRDTPLVDGALAHLVARVVRSYWGGDHSLFLGQVEYVRYGEGRPLLFHGGRYERLVEDPRVFAALPHELLTPILARGVERAFADGDAIMRIGDLADSLSLVLEGTVLVERPGRTVRLGVGELIGEIEVLDGGPRIADITAEGPVRVQEVAREDLLGALEAEPRAAKALIEVLAGRFRETS